MGHFMKKIGSEKEKRNSIYFNWCIEKKEESPIYTEADTRGAGVTTSQTFEKSLLVLTIFLLVY